MGVSSSCKVLKFWHNLIMRKIKKLLDEYRFPGFRPQAAIKGRFGDNRARIIQLIRRQKKLSAVVVEQGAGVSMIGKPELSEICLAVMQESIWRLRCAELIV